MHPTRSKRAFMRETPAKQSLVRADDAERYTWDEVECH
jgi:hypothetical protein